MTSRALATGAAAAAAGICYLPLAATDGWQGIAAIATPVWWVAVGLATAHHVFLLFALIGVYAFAVRRTSSAALGAFVVASVGNLLVTGVGAVQLTVLPALASHPTAASGLDCTPFYTAATAAGRALTAAACEPWRFGALEIWFGIGWLTLIAGSIWIAIEIWRGGLIARTAAALLAGGWVVQLGGIVAPLPALLTQAAYLALALAWISIGVGLFRASSRGASAPST